MHSRLVVAKVIDAERLHSGECAPDEYDSEHPSTEKGVWKNQQISDTGILSVKATSSWYSSTACTKKGVLLQHAACPLLTTHAYFGHETFKQKNFEGFEPM